MAWRYQWHTSGIGTRTSAFCSVINTLADAVTDSEVYMFADDTNMFKGIFGEDDELKLQQDLNQIHNWSQDSLMQYHPDKP